MVSILVNIGRSGGLRPAAAAAAAADPA